MKVLARTGIGPINVVPGDTLILSHGGQELVRHSVTESYIFSEGIVMSAEDGELLPDAGRALIGAFVEKKR